MNKKRGEFTINEILTQTSAWRKVLSSVENDKNEILGCFNDADCLIFTGCGSNYYMSLGAKALFQYLTGIPCWGIPSSELFLYPDTVLQKEKKALVIPLCRSGETTEVIKAIDLVNSIEGVQTLYIGCFPESSVARMCSYKLAISDCQERSVVTTKSHTTMFLSLQMIAALFADKNNYSGRQYLEELKNLPEAGENIMGRVYTDIQGIPLGEFSHFVFLGSSPFYGIACESMLKMKEMAIVPSDAFHSLEFRHGPKSILHKDVLVTLFLSDTALEYETELLKEIKGLGGSTLTICERADSEIKRYSDFLFQTGSNVNEFARSILFLPITQLLAFYKAVSKGIDVDTPQNLTYFVKL